MRLPPDRAWGKCRASKWVLRAVLVRGEVLSSPESPPG
nr:hypothetical protein JVH1_5811 [Rhodococcus sp. JVH1]